MKTAKTAGTSIEVYLSPLCDEMDIFTPFSEPEEGHVPRNYLGLFNPLPEIATNLAVRRRTGKVDLTAPLRDFFARRKFSHHIPAWQIRNRAPRNVWDPYYKFCVERNPWDKVVSGWNWYNKKYQASLSMDEYLTMCSRRIQARSRGVGICPFNIVNYSDPLTGKLLVDRIIRYEHLGAEFGQVLAHLEIPIQRPFDVHAKSGSRKDSNYREVFTKSQRRRVADLFKEEIELHNFSF